MNWQQRCEQIYANVLESGKRSVRAVAAATGISKSSVHRHMQAISRRNQYPESPLWEHQSGCQWLYRLVWAVIYVFGIKRGIGNETLSEFFHLVRLEGRIGVSPNALQRMRGQIEQQILNYRDEQHEQLQQSLTQVQVCVGADETFFEQMVLVLLDLPSGYIFVESQATARDYQTWLERVQQALGSVAGVKYLVSDRAQALVKLALEGLNCCSIPDLFHALRELNRQIGSPLALQLSRSVKQLSQAQETFSRMQVEGKPTQAQQAKLTQLKTQLSQIQSTQERYHNLIHQLSLSLHPFAIDGSGFQGATEVTASLLQHLQALSGLATTDQLPKLPEAVNKFSAQVSGMAAVVHAWWSWVLHNLGAHSVCPQMSNWVLTSLLPVVYWQQQMDKTKTPTLKQAYHSALAQAQLTYHHDPVTKSLSSESLQYWWSWAEWMVSKFQRTSSPVEGRNGYVSRIHHSARGLSASRLQVLTVIHNFDLKRSDGSTAAQRLFGRQFPNLFDYLIEHMGDLPQPRKARKTVPVQNAILHSVPA